jgi:hypothetical protein
MRVYGAFPSLLRPDWWARATTHRPVSSRPGGPGPPPTAQFLPDLVAQATTATPYRNQLHLSAVLAGSGTPFRNSVKPRCLPQPYVPTKILSTRREKDPGRGDGDASRLPF